MNLTIKQGSKSSKTRFDLSNQHITTTDFGTISPVNIFEVVPGDTFNLTMRVASRLSPLVVPTYGDIDVVTRAFFVPMRSLWKGFDEWISRNNDASLVSTLPVVTNTVLQNWFVDEQESRGLSVVSTSFESYDFVVNSSYFRFTQKGRWLYKILLSLGYSINFSYTNGLESGDETEMSLLPLLAFMRVLYDYVYPSSYVNGLGIGRIFEDRNYANPGEIIDKILPLLFLPFQQDYFTSAWANTGVHGPSDATGLTINEPYPSINDTTASVTANSSGQWFDNFGNNPGSDGISAYGHRLLQAVSDFITRNNIAGSRYFEQLFARFGVSSKMATPNRSQFIKSFRDKVSIVDVTSMASTEGSELGEQGAKGLMTGSQYNTFEFNADNESFGYLLVLSHIEPHSFYYQGRKRHVLHTDPLHFYTPEFDNLGLQPIRNDELFADFNNPSDWLASQNYGGKPNGVFGFSPTYSEYKTGQNQCYLTGDFRISSANTGLDSYHLGRVLPKPSQNAPLALNSRFLGVSPNDFDRIFQNVYTSFGFSLIPVDGADYSILSFNSVPVFYTVSPSITPQFLAVVVVRSDGSLTSLQWIPLDSNKGYLSFPYVIKLRELGYDVTSFLNTPFSMPVPSGTITSYSGDLGDRFEAGNLPTLYSFTYTGSGNISDGSLSFSLSSSGTPVITDYDALQLFTAQYFDHFVMYYDFKVTAHRKMLSISESIPIENGGAPISVDAYGNHL